MSRALNLIYTDDLHLYRKRHGDGRLFYVARPYRVAFQLDGVWTSVTVLSDFPTDLASIPSVIPKWIASKVQAHLEAAVIHDYLYRVHLFNRETSDLIFLAAMEAAGVGAVRRQMMYRAVRLFGGSAYDRHGSPPSTSHPHDPGRQNSRE